MAYLDCTAHPVTADGVLIQQIDLRVDVSAATDGGILTGEVSINGLAVEFTDSAGKTRWSEITGPMRDALTAALQADNGFQDRAWSALMEAGEAPDTEARHIRHQIAYHHFAAA